MFIDNTFVIIIRIIEEKTLNELIYHQIFSSFDRKSVTEILFVDPYVKLYMRLVFVDITQH